MGLILEANVEGLNPQHWVCATTSVSEVSYMLHTKRLCLLSHKAFSRFHGSSDYTLSSLSQSKRLKGHSKGQRGL